MRRAGPILIIVIAVACARGRLRGPARCPSNDGTTRRLETKLGLDLQGGLRIEYQVLPAEGKSPTRDDLAVMRQIIVNRIDKSGVAEPRSSPRATTGSSSRCRASRTRTRSATSSAPPAGSTSCRSARRQMAQDQEVGRRRGSRPSATTTTTELVRPVLGRPGRRGVDRRRTRPASGPSTSRSPATARTGSPHYTADQHRQLLRDRARRQGHQRPGDQRARSPAARSRSQSGGIGGYPLEEAQNLVTDPPVRPAAVPDRGARQHDGQPDARRGVPPAEPARGR